MFLGVVLIVLGMVFILIGVVAGILENKENTSVKGGAVVFIGPVPVLLATDRNSAVIVAVMALLLLIAAYLFIKK